MYNPISHQSLCNLKDSPNFAPKKCIAPLVTRRAPISLAVANVEKRGARDPAGWSVVSVMCVAQEISFHWISLSISAYSPNVTILFLLYIKCPFYEST